MRSSELDSRRSRFREIIDFEYLRSQKKYIIEAVDIDDLLLKLKKLKRVKIDMGEHWAIEDIKRSKIKESTYMVRVDGKLRIKFYFSDTVKESSEAID